MFGNRKKDSPGFFLLEFLALTSRAQLALAHACERRFGPQTAWCAVVAVIHWSDPSFYVGSLAKTSEGLNSGRCIVCVVLDGEAKRDYKVAKPEGKVLAVTIYI